MMRTMCGSAVNHGWAGVAVRGRFLRVLLKTASEGEASSPIMRMTSGSGAEKPQSTVIAVELARSFRAKGHNVSDGAASFISLTERPMSAVDQM